jgi:hypothetical protein
MKHYTITGYNRSNKAQMTLNYNAEELTVKMAEIAMRRIQTFFAAPLRFEITEVNNNN